MPENRSKNKVTGTFCWMLFGMSFTFLDDGIKSL